MHGLIGEVRGRALLLLAVALGAAPAAAGAASAPAAARPAIDPADGAFTVVIVPDTQHEVDTDPNASTKLEFPWQIERLRRNADWICESRERLRIAAVLHEGDMVEGQSRRDHSQWDYFAALPDRLEACGLPVLYAMGNHDCVNGPRGCAAPKGVEAGANFQRYVAPRMEREPEWQGKGPTLTAASGRCGLVAATIAPSRVNWIRFAKRFAAVSLDWFGCAAEDEWARQVATGPAAGLHVILLGHEAARGGESPSCSGVAGPGTARARELAAAAPSVFARVGGHHVGDFSCYALESLGGHPVLNAFSNFQTNKGQKIAGTLVLMSIDVTAPAGKPNVCFRQYNPFLDAYDVAEPERCFRVEGLD